MRSLLMANASAMFVAMIGATVWLASPSGMAAEEPRAAWPQWRGAAHNGISTETGLADQWPQNGPPVLWVRDIGQGYSAFIAVGDKVFTQTQTLYEQAVICLDADTGRQIWSYRYGWPYEGGGLYPGPRATPCWYQNRVYFAAPDGTVGCLNAADGKLVWSKNPKQEHRGQGTDFGCACSPLVIDDKVIVPVGGRTASVVALNALNGETLWKSGDAPASYCTPVPITFQGRKLVVTLLENSLAAFDLQLGTRLWNLEFSQGYDEHAAAPLYREPDLFIAGPFRSGAKLFRMSPLKDKPAAEELQIKTVWENPKFSNDVASSVLLDGFIYGFDLKDAQSRLNRPSRGEFRCLDFASGKVQWSTDKIGQANIIAADGKLILFNDNGEVILARADSRTFTELARTAVFKDEVCWTPPALHRGRLFLRTQNRAVCLYLGDKPLQIVPSQTAVADLKPTRRFNPARLLGGEREYPATTPEWDEFQDWYRWSLLGLAAAAAVAVCLATAVSGIRWIVVGQVRSRTATPPVVELFANGTRGSWSQVWRISFWITVLMCGAFASGILNPRQEKYLFSWPLGLWAVFQLTLMTISWCERQADKRRARWWSRGAGLVLIANSVIYFHLCRSLGLSIEWSYLMGFLPAFPVAALCARPLTARHRCVWLADSLLAAVSFSAYFWACAGFMKWWLVVGS